MHRLLPHAKGSCMALHGAFKLGSRASRAARRPRSRPAPRRARAPSRQADDVNTGSDQVPASALQVVCARMPSGCAPLPSPVGRRPSAESRRRGVRRRSACGCRRARVRNFAHGPRPHRASRCSAPAHCHWHCRTSQSSSTPRVTGSRCHTNYSIILDCRARAPRHRANNSRPKPAVPQASCRARPQLHVPMPSAYY